MPGDSPALLGIPDIKFQDILKITCEVMGDLHKSRMFDSQTMQASIGPICKTNKAQKVKADNADVNDANSKMPDYFRSSINREANKGASQVLMNKIHNETKDIFQELDV